jgi:glycosyltransferase involved in cell wall biosynthesis
MAAYGMRRLYLVENGVAGASARPRADVRAALELADDVPVVGFVGRLHRHKGYDVLMEAWPKVLAAVPDARLAVIGDGELGPAEGPNVIPLRFVNGPDWLAGFDVLAVPSRCDTLSYALLEAAVAGVPTAATEVGGVNELVGAVDPSLIVPIEDVDGMARNIVRLLKDPGYRQRIGKALEIRARHFTVNRMVDGTVGVYRDVLAKAAG